MPPSFFSFILAKVGIQREEKGMVLMSRHVNNVRYVRWIETARIRYAESLELPGGQVRGMLVSQC